MKADLTSLSRFFLLAKLVENPEIPEKSFIHLLQQLPSEFCAAIDLSVTNNAIYQVLYWLKKRGLINEISPKLLNPTDKGIAFIRLFSQMMSNPLTNPLPLPKSDRIQNPPNKQHLIQKERNTPPVQITPDPIQHLSENDAFLLFTKEMIRELKEISLKVPKSNITTAAKNLYGLWTSPQMLTDAPAEYPPSTLNRFKSWLVEDSSMLNEKDIALIEDLLQELWDGFLV